MKFIAGVIFPRSLFETFGAAIKISIITPSYNQAEFIGSTIDSVLSQEGDFDLEYCVFDGGSTDGTQEILASYKDRLSWISEPDDGQVAAINRGLADAQGDVVGWLNSDDVLLPGALQNVAQTFREHSECNWLHGDCVVIDRHGREIRRWVSTYKRYHASRYSLDSLLVRNFISQMTVFWRRELMDKVGFLDPQFRLAFDYEYWLRLAQVSDPIYIPQKLAAFRWYETSKSGATFVEQFREDRLIAQKHGLRRALSKRISNQLIVSAYRLLAFGRRFTPSLESSERIGSLL